MLVLLAALAAASGRIEAVAAEVSCDGFRIRATGRVLEPRPLLGFNLALTPRSGPPIVVTDSFAVGAGAFAAAVERSWRAFGLAIPPGTYRLSGSAVLVTGVRPLDDAAIEVAPAALRCPSRAPGGGGPRPGPAR